MTETAICHICHCRTLDFSQYYGQKACVLCFPMYLEALRLRTPTNNTMTLASSADQLMDAHRGDDN